MAEVGSGRMDYADAQRIAAHVSLILSVAALSITVLHIKDKLRNPVLELELIHSIHVSMCLSDVFCLP